MRDQPVYHLQPTRPDRGWIVNPFALEKWWLAIATVLPAIFFSILVMMDQNITSVIINRKDNKLKVKSDEEYRAQMAPNVLLLERVWVSLGPGSDRGLDDRMFGAWNSVLRGCNCDIVDACPFVATDVRNRSAWRETAVPGTSVSHSRAGFP